MPSTRLSCARLLQLAAVALLLFMSAAHADGYGDITTLLKDGKASQALVQIEQRLATSPKDPQLRFLRGVAQSETKQTKAAIDTFTELTRDYPELPEPYNNLAVLYAQENQLDKARTALEMAIRTNPSYATAHENLGDIYAKLAGQAYNKALQLDGASGASVKPKLALIRELFSARTGAGAGAGAGAGTQAAAAVTPTAAPAPRPVEPAKAAPAASATPTETAATPQAAASPAQAQTAAVGATAQTQAGSPADADAEDAVAAAVKAWAHAWSSKDMNAYLAAYASDFAPADKSSRAAWEKERTARIVGKSKISVQVSNLKIKVDGSQARAHFRQEYQGDALRVNSAKTLLLVHQGGNWKISSESTGG